MFFLRKPYYMKQTPQLQELPHKLLTPPKKKEP